MLEVDAEFGYDRGNPLARLTFSLGPGESVFLRGPNGSGKSTVLASIAGLRYPLNGSIDIEGRSTAATHSRGLVGYVADPPTLFDELSAAEHVTFVTSMWSRDIRRFSSSVSQSSLMDGVPEAPAGLLSLGQRKRLGLVLGLLHSPWLWVLDEPFNGLDASSSDMLHRLLDAHLDTGGAVICAAHGENAWRRADSRVIDLGVRASGGAHATRDHG